MKGLFMINKQMIVQNSVNKQINRTNIRKNIGLMIFKSALKVHDKFDISFSVALQIPFSVIKPVTSLAGVTSKP